MAVGDAPSYADLQQRLARAEGELAQAREREAGSLAREAAIGEILRVIAGSPTNLQRVLDVIAENAARVCEATDAVIWRLDGNVLCQVAGRGPIPKSGIGLDQVPVGRGWVTGRAVVDRRTVHVRDLAAEPEDEYPDGRAHQRLGGNRTTLATPLLREGEPVGAILIRRQEVRPFTAQQIALHGGTIRARSEVGVGSAFTVMLPQPRVRSETGPS